MKGSAGIGPWSVNKPMSTSISRLAAMNWATRGILIAVSRSSASDMASATTRSPSGRWSASV